ncbi:MAG TPA: NeuD/PglB/VioB family sugar acetyltransferase [Magnetospirillum sp.]|nr:NeuD/PglB/VioB family sugar acetyltransferase [Magnetospirillum sp.]
MTAPVTTIVVVGAGGLGREVAVYVRDAIAAGTLRADLRGFLDDTDADPAALGVDVPVLGPIDAYRPLPGDGVVIAVGDPAARRALADRLAARGARFVALVHPLAYVAQAAAVADGAIVAPFATIGTGARLGAHCLINTHAGIGHDAVVGECCAVSPHAVINGGARLGQGVMIGSGAVVVPRLKIGDGAQVAAGAVVLSDVAAGVMVWGNPARPMPRVPSSG